MVDTCEQTRRSAASSGAIGGATALSRYLEWGSETVTSQEALHLSAFQCLFYILILKLDYELC